MIKRSCIIVAHCCCPGPFRAHTKWQDGAVPPPAQVLTFMRVCDGCPHVLLSVLLFSCPHASLKALSPYRCCRVPLASAQHAPLLLYSTLSLPCGVTYHHRQWGDTPLMSSSSQTGQAQHLMVSALHPSHGRWEPITHPAAGPMCQALP